MKTKLMTILQVLPELNDGGVERGTVEMAAYIKTQGARSMVASAGGKRVADLKAAGVAHVTLPLMRKNPFSVLLNALRLARLIKKEGVTVVHARSRAPAWSGLLACKITGIRFVTTFHGTHSLKGFGKRWYNSVMARGAVVVANSGFIAAHIKEFYSDCVQNRPLLVAQRGVEIDTFQPLDAQARKDMRAKLNIDDKQKMVLLVGRISRWKGQDVFLKALAELPDDVVGVLAGGPDTSGVYLEELKALADTLGIEHRVQFLGARSDVAQLYGAADVAVSASTKPEAFGRVAIEAMACGTPIVATNHGGSLETILDGKTGILVSVGEAQALAQGVLRLRQDEALRDTMGRAGVAHVQEHFTVAKMCAVEFSSYTA